MVLEVNQYTVTHSMMKTLNINMTNHLCWGWRIAERSIQMDLNFTLQHKSANDWIIRMLSSGKW